MYLPADGIAICTGSREKEPQRLPARITAALGHYVVESAGGLRVKLVEDAGGNIQAMLRSYFTGQHLIEGIDRERAKYYNYFSSQKWGARDNYDLMISTSGKNIKQVSVALAQYLKALLF